MSSSFGDVVKLSVFGESHGECIGVVIDNLPAGEKINLDEIQLFMNRRAPGRDKTATQRKEADVPHIVSGYLDGYTTGAPLCAIIDNNNTRSKDYSNLEKLPRPGHSDYSAYLKYKGYNDVRGGGHFSGRLTAPLVFAGSVFRQILRRKGIEIASHIHSIGTVKDTLFNPVEIPKALIDKLNKSSFALIDEDQEEAMRDVIYKAKSEGDSVGGIIECVATGLSGGLGSTMFGSIESIISSVIFAIPAVKGIEFGSGFYGSTLSGSENNDEYTIKEGKVITKTNNCGGILGGISNGMPIIFNVAFKPTPSIAKIQKSVDLISMQEKNLQINGRHDPCIVIRALPVVESACAIALMQILATDNNL